jgi:CobQ-like glutamine amidotransferase family enzyme
MGAMTERQQELALDKLRQYRSQLQAHINRGTLFLLTGNAMELFGSYIENEDKSRVEGLHLFPTYAKRQMMNRYNSLILGEFEGIRIVGFKNQFSHSYGDNKGQYFYKVIRGAGIHTATDLEGIRIKNCFGTYTLGPFLVHNPLFTKYLITLMGVGQPHLAFEETIMEAYRVRLAEFEDRNIQF